MVAQPVLASRAWQQAALEAWRQAERHGIVAAATGTGKTRVALVALQEALAQGHRGLVVVPTQALQEQWRRQLRLELNLGSDRLGQLGGRAPEVRPEHDVVLAVLASARRHGRQLLDSWRMQGRSTLLVVDECHWAGSTESARLLGPWDRTLGLSATPERYDDGFEEVLEPLLGPVVYRYRLRDALDDGLLAPLTVINVGLELDGAERAEYTQLTDRLTALRRRLEQAHPGRLYGPDWIRRLNGLLADPDARAAQRILQLRRRLVVGARGRRRVLESLAMSGALRTRRTLVFNETIAQAEDAVRLLTSAGELPVLDHSGLPAAARRTAHQRFRNGAASILVAVRTADEGVDVPDADCAVLVSSSLTERQRVQRLGRVVRPSGTDPLAYSFYALGTPEEELAEADAELVGPGRVRTVLESELPSFISTTAPGTTAAGEP